MRFSVENNDLSKALNIVSKAVSSKSTSSALQCVYFEATDNILTLKATDGELSIVTTVEADVTQEGRTIITLKTLFDLIRTFPSERVFFDIDEVNYSVNISCATLEINLLAMDPTSFPLFEKVSVDSMITVDNEVFRDLIRECVFCCAPSISVNPVITGINIELEENGIICTALDGYKMSVRKQQLDNPGIVDKDIIVPGRIMNEVLKIVSLYDDPVCFGVQNNRFVIDIGETQIMSNLIEGTYINYRGLIPSTINTVVKLGKNELMASIERAGLMVTSVENSMVKLVIEDDRLIISSSSVIGTISESIGISKTGNDIKIAFNVRYLSELIKNIKDERIILEFRDSNSPCLIKPVDDDRFTFLVMPVRYID
ncbi:MAG: DNA polymerase III subunit beta [Eubacteriaceae bacterium]|nr:DNA polymerase III subunit beta [Eubacteriaceae bacterium]